MPRTPASHHQWPQTTGRRSLLIPGLCSSGRFLEFPESPEVNCPRALLGLVGPEPPLLHLQHQGIATVCPESQCSGNKA